MPPFSYEELVTLRNLCAAEMRAGVERLARAVERGDESAAKEEERLQQHYRHLVDRLQEEMRRFRQ